MALVQAIPKPKNAHSFGDLANVFVACVSVTMTQIVHVSTLYLIIINKIPYRKQLELNGVIP